MTLLLSSSGKEQELGLISPGLVGGVGIDPMRAEAISHLSVCILLQEWGVLPCMCIGWMGVGNWWRENI